MGCSGPGNTQFAESMGADHVINYREQNFTENKNTYDIIFDTVGTSSFGQSKSALKKNGIYLSPNISFSLLFQMLRTKFIGTKKAVFSATGMMKADEMKAMLNEIIACMQEYNIQTFVDTSYSLDDIAKAHSFIETGHKKGNIAIVM